MDSLSELIHEADEAFKPELKVHLHYDQSLHTKSSRHKRVHYGVNSLRVIPEQSSGNSRYITVCPREDNDYIYLQGTSSSSLTPGFRHGPICIPKFNSNTGSAVLDSIQDWASFQMATAGIDCNIFEPYLEEETSLEDIRSWLEDMGLGDECISALTSWKQNCSYQEHTRSLSVQETLSELITLHNQPSTDDLVMRCNLESDLATFLEWESQIVGATEMYWLNSSSMIHRTENKYNKIQK